MLIDLRSSADKAWMVSIGLLGAVYVGYALRGGFFFDDFLLYNQYAAGHGEWWEYRQHFGRILTRYGYWTWLPGVFGNRPEFYFLFNFVFVLFGAWAFGRFLAALGESDRLMLPAAALYLLAATTFHAFSWIAAFQHIGAYPFVFVFLWKMIELARHWEPRIAVVAVASFALAMISNQFAVVAPAAAFILTLPFLHRNPRYLVLVVVLGIFSLAVAMVLVSGNPKHAYAQTFSLARVAANSGWYAERLGFGSSLPKYLAILSIILIVAARSTRSVSLLGVAVVAALPFIFLELRRNTYFIHLAYVFAMAALLLAACRLDRSWLRRLTLALLVALVGYSSFHLHRTTYRQPLGADLKRQIEQVTEALPGAGHRVCVLYDSEDARWRRRHHHMTVALSAYQVLDHGNTYIRYDDVLSCQVADYGLYITFDASGKLGHRLVDAATGEAFVIGHRATRE